MHTLYACVCYKYISMFVDQINMLLFIFAMPNLGLKTIQIFRVINEDKIYGLEHIKNSIIYILQNSHIYSNIFQKL